MHADNTACNAFLMMTKKKLSRTLEFSMRDYMLNDSKCHRNVLFENMEGYDNNNIECQHMCLISFNRSLDIRE